MKNYFCRITMSYENFRAVIPRIEQHCNKLIVYEHNEDRLNVHIHFLIIAFSKSTDSLKGWIKKDTGVSVSSSNWSFKTKYKPYKEANEQDVEETAIIYMAKGTLAPCYNYGFSDEAVNGYKLRWLDYKKRAKQQQLTSYLVKETAAASKLRQNEMIDEIIKRLETREDQSQSVILSLIRQVVIVENKTLIGRYKVRDYYDVIWARSHPQDWMSSMLALVKPNNFLA